SGVSPAFDLGVIPVTSNYAVRFEGYFRAEREGNYRFVLESDDGSVLHVDGQKVVDNDGVHATKAATGQTILKKGVHRIAVGFFGGGGGAEVMVSVQGPGLALQNLAGFRAATEAGLDAAPPKKTVNEDDLETRWDLVALGRVVFAKSGCAN